MKRFRLWLKALSVRHQLIASIALTHAVLMSVFVFDLVARQRDFIQEAEKSRALGLAQVLALNSSSWVLANDVVGLQELLRAYATYPDLRYMMVTDTTGRVLAHSDATQIGRFAIDTLSQRLQISPPRTQLLFDNQRVLDVAAPVTQQERITAWVRVGMNADIDARIREVVTRQGILYTLIAIAVGVLSATLIGRRLTRGFDALLAVVEATREGRRDRRVQIDRSDEVGRLASAFNCMLEEIESYDRERQAKQQEVTELNVALEKRVEDRTQELRTSLKQLSTTVTDLKDTQKKLVEQEKMASLGGLVAGVAHEINTPIGVAITASSHLEETLKSTQASFLDNRLTRLEYQKAMEDLIETAQMVMKNLERAAQLVKSFKRLAVDQSSEDIRQFNLKEYLETIIVSLRPNLKRTHHEIRLDVSDDITLFSFPGAISQIFTNLIMNSLIHGFEGIDSGIITICARSTGSRVLLDYFDNGKGVAPEIRHRIFEPFVTTHRHSGGSGLGTHIIYNLVTQALGGTIRFDAEYAPGAHFKLEFPLEAPTRQAPVTTTPMRGERGGLAV